MPAQPALVSDPLLARKKAIPKWEWLFCDCPQVLLSACPPRISQGKECVQGKPLPGFPCAFNQRAAVGGADFCSAKISSTKREPPFGWLSFVTAHRFCCQLSVVLNLMLKLSPVPPSTTSSMSTQDFNPCALSYIFVMGRHL